MNYYQEVIILDIACSIIFVPFLISILPDMGMAAGGLLLLKKAKMDSIMDQVHVWVSFRTLYGLNTVSLHPNYTCKIKFISVCVIILIHSVYIKLKSVERFFSFFFL